jgi:hypothetical protein
MEPTEEQYKTVSDYYQRAVDGHVYIRETLDTFLEVLSKRVERLGSAPRILELGSHAGVVTASLLERWPGASILVSDEDPMLVAMSRRRLANCSITYHADGLACIAQTSDLVISVARHHHLPHGYLQELRRIMTTECVYVLADELCPEYCYGEHAMRITNAEVIHVVGGYILTTHAEVREFADTGTIPEIARELEALRQRALWRWYRFVVDEAVERGYFDIAVGELQSTHDDLITGSDAEHKFSPLIVERQFQLSGFQLLSKRLVGPVTDQERQSMFVYEFSLA